MRLRPRDDLRDAQRFISDQIVDHAAKLIVARMGHGKTGATLDGLVRLFEAGTIRRVLVVAPLRVATDTWPDEILTWEHTCGIGFAVCVGTDKARRAALAERAQITIINREVLPWLWEQLRSGADWDFDCVVVDESSAFKAGKKRTKLRRLTRFGVLAQARKKIARIYLLTGTPAPNGVADLWGQIYLLDQGQRLGASQNAFHQRWFDMNKYTFKVTPKSHAEAEIMAIIADVMVSLPPVQLVDDPVMIPVPVRLSKSDRAEYDAFERTLVSQMHDVEAVNRGVLTNKLLQFSNGAMYQEDGAVVPVHTAKLDALDDLVETAAGDPMLVFYSFKFDLAQIRLRHPDAVVLNESDTAVSDWNEGRIKLLLAHPASCAHGLNLQYGGHIAVWFGLTWSLELYQQANARLPRPGQQHLVAIYQIIAEGTADEVVLDVLSGKATTQDSVTRAVMRRLANLTLEDLLA